MDMELLNLMYVGVDDTVINMHHIILRMTASKCVL